MDYEVETDTSEPEVAGDEYSQVAPEADTTPEVPTDSAKVNKSAEVRAEATRLIEAGHHPRPVEIVRALEKRGISVAPAQVSIVLKKMGVPGRIGRAGRGKKATASKPPERPALPPVPEKPLSAPPVIANRPQSSGAGEAAYTFEQLLSAKAFVEEVGTPREAIELLEALDRLLQ